MQNSKEKIKKIRERALLREFINLQLSKKLLEQDGDYYGGYDDAGIMVGGYAEPGAPSSNIATFLTKSDFARLLGLDAIHNAFKTAAYGIKRLATKTFGESKILAKSLFWYLMPVFLKSSKFDNIIDMAEQERAVIENQLEKIDGEYAEVLKKNNEIFENPDFNFAFFVAAPGAVIGSEIIKKSLKASLEMFDVLVGKDNVTESIGNQITDIFEDLTTRIGLNPKNYTDRAAVESRILNNLRQDFPNLTQGELHDIINEVQGQRLEEQSIKPNLSAQKQIDAYLTTPDGLAYISGISNGLDKLRRHISSSQSQQKMNNSPIAKAGQQILATNIVNAAKSAINKFDMNYIKTNYQQEIDKFFNEKGVTDPEQKKELIEDPEVVSELEKLLKNTLKKAYTKQLDELEKINPMILKSVVASGKKQIDAM